MDGWMDDDDDDDEDYDERVSCFFHPRCNVVLLFDSGRCGGRGGEAMPAAEW